MNEIMDLNLSLPAQLLNIGKRIAQLLDERLEPASLSSAKLWALQSIVTSGETTAPVTVTCLAEFMSTTKSNVTAMVDRLIEEGLVTRERSEEDRRTVVIALTDVGHQRYEAGAAAIRALHHEIAATLSAEEQVLLSCLLQKLPK